MTPYLILVNLYRIKNQAQWKELVIIRLKLSLK
nr:MAG TPA: hypothetical protein [Caudoviricetes sp.]